MYVDLETWRQRTCTAPSSRIISVRMLLRGHDKANDAEGFVLVWLLGLFFFAPGSAHVALGTRERCERTSSSFTQLVHSSGSWANGVWCSSWCVCVLVEKGNEASCEKWSRSLSFLLM